MSLLGRSLADAVAPKGDIWHPQTTDIAGMLVRPRSNGT